MPSIGEQEGSDSPQPCVTHRSGEGCSGRKEFEVQTYNEAGDGLEPDPEEDKAACSGAFAAFAEPQEFTSLNPRSSHH